MALLDIKNLHISFVQYNGVLRQSVIPVVTDLNLQLHEGEILAVVGASGSGKSLLAHAIMGLLPDNAVMEGQIHYRGKQLTEQELTQLRGKELRLVPQSSAYLNPLLKVSRQFRVRNGEGHRQNDIFNIDAMKGLYPFELSGGMTRKVLLTSATMPGGARLIIADEPTPGLDVQAVKEALAGLTTLAKQGCGVLFITHDIEAAAAIADRVVVMNEGSCVDIAAATDFTSDGELLQHPYTASLWRALPCNGLRLPEKPASKLDPYPINDSAGELLLQCHAVGYRYKHDPWLFRGMNVTLRAGEVVGLVGPSGIGKSSLAHIMAGYLDPIEGKVATQEQTIHPVQLVLQHPEHAFNPRLRLKDSLAESWQADAATLERLGIMPQWLQRFPHELSGGQLQRISIARALHPEAKILIADEMTAMLDALTQARIWHEVLSIAKERGMAIVLISHDPHLVQLLCHRTIELK